MAENRVKAVLKIGKLLKIGHYSLKKNHVFISKGYCGKGSSRSLAFTN